MNESINKAKHLVYLAGGIEYAKENGIGWRDIVESSLAQLGLDCFNPCKDEGPIRIKHGLPTFDSVNKLKYADLTKYCDFLVDIINYDVLQLQNSKFVVAYLDASAIGGTSGELTLASYLEVPIIGILIKEELTKIPGWNIALCDKIFYSIGDAIKFIVENSEYFMQNKILTPSEVRSL